MRQSPVASRQSLVDSRESLVASRGSAVASRPSARRNRQSKDGNRQSRMWQFVALALPLLSIVVGAQGRGGVASFPAQQRDPADPNVVARGRAVYDTECRSCHGPDLRGGEQ